MIGPWSTRARVRQPSGPPSQPAQPEPAEKPAWPPSRNKLMTPKREARRAKKSGQLLHDADVLVD